jgi:hypothetical protein
MMKNGEDLQEYAAEWITEHGKKFSFEAVHSKIRREQALRFILDTPHGSILEIGCGLDPLFPYVPDFDRYFIIEPIDKFAAQAIDVHAGDSRIRVLNGFLEDCVQDLSEFDPDVIIANGVLHEVADPDVFLHAIQGLCREETKVFVSTPNVRSVHRLLAQEMGLIPDITEPSALDIRYGHRGHFDRQSLCTLLERHGFEVVRFSTYFVKPFTNEQMEAIIERGIVDPSVIHGLERLIEYMPDLGSEMYAVVRKGPEIPDPP